MSDYKSYKEHLEDLPGNPYNITIDDVSNTPIGLRRCQYWVNGLPGICKYWKDERCTYSDKYPDDPTPSLYNNSKCDFLGRRSSCDKYDNAGNYDYSEYVCIAPDPFRTGLLRMVVEQTPPFEQTGEYVAVPKDKILGYNGDDNGVGQCDGRGTGCGADGYSGESSDNIVVCNYFKPWHMGFGLIKPEGIKTLAIYLNSPETYFSELYNAGIEFDLPFNLKIFNSRSKMQKCVYWDKDEGSEFVNDDWQIYLEDESDLPDISVLCTCEDTEAKKYATQRLDNYPFGLQNVWSEQNCIICNGAKPECPRYTGQWTYCVDEKMQDGAIVSAQQMMELRFWLRDWESQEIYDEYYSRLRPNTNLNDPGTPDLFTFKKWNTFNIEEPHKSLIEGDRIHMCMPAPYLNKVFLPNDYIEITPMIYNDSQGTTDEENPSFPTLIRDLDTDIPKPLKVIYPYPYKEVWTEPCETPTDDFYIKKSNSIEGDGIYVFGSTVRNKEVYVFNHTIINELSTSIPCPQELLELSAAFFIDVDQRQDFYYRLAEYIELLETSYSEHLYKATASSDYGLFMIGPVKLNYQEYNNLIICANIGGVWEFTKRKVWSQWYGGMVIQDSYTMDLNYDDTEGGYDDEVTYRYLPFTKSSGKLQPLYGNNNLKLSSAPVGLQHVYSHKRKKVSRTEGIVETDYYGYTLVENTKTDSLEENWAQISNSLLFWVETSLLEINYIFDYEIDNARLVYECEDEDLCDESLVGTFVELEALYPESNTQKLYFHPNSFVLKLKEENDLRVFDRFWKLYVTYKYQSIDVGAQEDDDSKEVLFPSLASGEDFSGAVYLENTGLEIDVTYYGHEYDYNIDNPSPSYDKRNFNVTSIRDKTVSLMSYFVDEEYRLISVVATKFLIPVSRINCRAVEIDYRFKSDALVKQLTTEGRFATIKTVNLVPEYTGESTVHYSHPVCGDHDLDTKGYGAMWFPFTCDQKWGGGSYEPYNERQPANFCDAAIEGTYFETETDMLEGRKTRLMGPYKNQTFVGPSLNWLESCAPMWQYFFSSTEGFNTIWIGDGNIRDSRQCSTYYALMNEELPPFGPTNRERMSRWLSEDYVDYISFKNPSPTAQMHDDRFWFPVVFDNRYFNYNFNSLYIPNTLLGQSNDISFVPNDSLDFFNFNSQLNHYISSDVEETIDTTVRYTFEQVFGEDAASGYGLCSYPPPVYSCYKPEIIITSSGTAEIETVIKDCIYVYHFTQPYTNWVWRENWKDIERGGEGNRLCFMDIVKPPYSFDYYKKEHRFISEEGEYTMSFVPPELPRKIQAAGVLVRPSVGIGSLGAEATYPRWFDIIYDEYDESRVDWYDIDSGVEPSPGSTNDDDNIYQLTMGSSWLHDENTIYDPTATDQMQSANIFVKSVETVGEEDVDVDFGVYNTGVIADLYKDRLKYMPYVINDEQIFDSENMTTNPESLTASGSNNYVPKKLEDIEYVWYTEDNDTVTIHVDNKTECLYYLPGAIKGPTCAFDGEPRPDKTDGKGDCSVQGDSGSCSEGEKYSMPYCIAKIVIKGYWGTFEDLVIGSTGAYTGESNKIFVCKPGIEITEIKTTINPQDNLSDQVWPSETGRSVVYTSTEIVPTKTQQFESFEIEIELKPDPKRMTIDRSNKSIIELTGNNEKNNYLCIESIEAYAADYITGQENIKVWERKYLISVGDSSPMKNKTINGYEDDILAPDMDTDNSTLVFAYAKTKNGSDFEAMDKCRSICAKAIPQNTEEVINLTKTNLAEKEIEVQKELYEDSYANDGYDSNITKYNVVVPPILEDFFIDVGIYKDLEAYLNEISVEFRSDKLIWEKNALLQQYMGDGDMEVGWQPSGHIYQWSDEVVLTRCWLIGPVEEAVDAEYVHVDHNKGSVEPPQPPSHATPQVGEHQVGSMSPLVGDA